MKQIKIHQTIDATILDDRYENELEQIFEGMLFSDEGMESISKLSDEFLENAKENKYNTANSVTLTVAEVPNGGTFYIRMCLEFKSVDSDYTQAYVSVVSIEEITIDEFLDDMLEIDKIKENEIK